MVISRRNPAGFRLVLALVAALAVAPRPSIAAEWPERSVKVLVPYGPGGNTDIIARHVGQRLSEALGQQFVIENKPGASGAIAVEAVARAQPDGYTLLLASLPQFAIVPAMGPVKYDPVADFAPVTAVCTNSFVLAISAELPTRTAAEFVEFVKARPGQLSYASGGPGSHMNLAMALYLKRNGLDMSAVHFRGGTEPLNSVIAGHTPAGMLNASDIVAQASNGKLRALLYAGPKRLPQLPEVPTAAEVGLADFVVTAWNGIAAPAGTPPAIVERIAAEVQKAAKEKAFAEHFSALGFDLVASSPQEFAVAMARDIKVWGDVVRQIGTQDKPAGK